MNRKFLVITALFALMATDAFSQVKGKVRGGVGIGVHPRYDEYHKGYHGIAVNLKYNLQDNMNVGLSGWWGAYIYKIPSSSVFTCTYDYYYKKRGNAFRPFVGGGLGFYTFPISYTDYSLIYAHFYDSDQKIGGFLTTGFEWWKLRISAEYNLIPPSTRYTQNHKFTISNSYYAITAGFFIGGGNRKKEAAKTERKQAELAEREEKESFSYFSKNYVAKELNQWLQKGEFERTDDWQQRISETNRNAKEAELRKDVGQAYIAERSKTMPAGNITLGAYDADKEMFLIKNNIHGDWHAPVPVEEAPGFKNNWSSLVKTPQWVIRNDKMAFAGYIFEPAKVVAANNATTESPKTSPTQQGVAAGASAKGDVSARERKAVVGLNYVYAPKAAYPNHGIGAKFLYRLNVPVRLGGEFTYFLPETETGDLFIMKVKTKFTGWEAGVNGHYLIAAGKHITLYPSAGLGMYGWKGKADMDAGKLGGTSSSSISENRFAFSLGGGFDFALSSNLLLNIELRYKHVSDEKEYNANFSAGLAYRF